MSKRARVDKTKAGNYQVKYPLGYNYAKQKYEHFQRTLATPTEAYALAKEIEDYIYHGGRLDRIRSKFGFGASPLFREYASRWLYMRKEQGRDGKLGKKLEIRTVAENASHVKRMIASIGYVPMDKLTSEVICKMLFELQVGDDQHKQCNGTYRQHIYATLNLVLKSAMRDEIIHDNPLLCVERPERDSVEKRSLTADEARNCIKTIAAMRNLTAKAFGVLLCLTCGLRPSEMFALTWDDVHPDAPQPYIRVWRSAVREKQARKTTKTGKERVVPILPDMIPLYLRWADEQKRWLEKMGMWQTGKTPVVTNANSGMVVESSFRRWLHKNAADLGLPDWVCPYNLRHTFVTLGCIGCDINLKTIGYIVGHVYITTTEGYIHRLDSQVCEAARAISGFLFPDAPRPVQGTCFTCAHWTPSPVVPMIGACWAKGMQNIVATSAEDICYCNMRKTA